MNPHGNPIRPSSVRVCQFRHPGTAGATIIKRPAAMRQAAHLHALPTLLPVERKQNRGDHEQDGENGRDAREQRLARPGAVEHARAPADQRAAKQCLPIKSALVEA